MKKLFINLFTASASLFTSLHADLPQPYSSINHLPQTPYFVLDGYVFFSLIDSQQSSVIVDVESKDAGVARYIAQQAAGLPAITEVYSVNSWQSLDPSVRHPFQQFLSNVIQENTASLVIPIRMSSKEAAEALNITADFISLVGGNSEKGIYNDILAWYPHLSDKGVLCGNNWYENDVQVGVTTAAAALDLNLQISGNVWYFIKGSP